jgi:hypothetical protein
MSQSAYVSQLLSRLAGGCVPQLCREWRGCTHPLDHVPLCRSLSTSVSLMWWQSRRRARRCTRGRSESSGRSLTRSLLTERTLTRVRHAHARTRAHTHTHTQTHIHTHTHTHTHKHTYTHTHTRSQGARGALYTMLCFTHQHCGWLRLIRLFILRSCE